MSSDRALLLLASGAAAPASFGGLEGSQAAAAAAAALSPYWQQPGQEGAEAAAQQACTQLAGGTKGGEPRTLSLQRFTPVSRGTRCAAVQAAPICTGWWLLGSTTAGPFAHFPSVVSMP